MANAWVPVSLPDDVIQFLDTLGPNRREAIVAAIRECRDRREADEFGLDLKSYCELCDEAGSRDPEKLSPIFKEAMERAVRAMMAEAGFG